MANGFSSQKPAIVKYTPNYHFQTSQAINQKFRSGVHFQKQLHNKGLNSSKKPVPGQIDFFYYYHNDKIVVAKKTFVVNLSVDPTVNVRY